MKACFELATACLLALSCSAVGAAEAFSASYDRSTRIQRVQYQDDLVVRIPGFANTPFVIEFDRNDPVGDVAFPVGAPFEIVKKGFRLFVRPTAAPKQPVTILVTSTVKSRSYVFDVVAGDRSSVQDRVSKVVFSYPEPPSPPTPPLPPAPPPAVAAIDQRAGPANSSYRNANYSLQVVAEAVDVRPREAFDDGRFTYFRFPNNIEIPAIYRGTSGSADEWLVNSHRDGDYVVMHAVSEVWTLRLGGTVLGIFNDSYEPDGVPPSNGTTVVGLERTVRP